jgi:D-hexose-6-phosphate mutarotase
MASTLNDSVKTEIETNESESKYLVDLIKNWSFLCYLRVSSLTRIYVSDLELFLFEKLAEEMCLTVFCS